MKHIFYLLIFIILLLATIFISISIGAVNISLKEILDMSVSFLTGEKRDFSQMHWDIVFRVRLPRIIVGLLVGASLSIAGAVYQGFLRNPLADPYILGISSGAAVGAGISFWLKLDNYIHIISPTPLLAFIGSILAVFLVYQIALVRGRAPVDTFLLAGVIVGSFFGSLVFLLMILAQEDLHKLIFWIMGSLAEKDWIHVYLVLPYLLIGGIVILINARNLNMITLGDENAHHLGVDVERVKIILIASASLITAASVSACGLIGFVGLIIPHIIRIIFGADHRILIPFSAIAGAILLVFSDTLARTILSPMELPVGVITALLGAPFFCYLLRRRKFSFFS